MLDKEYRLMHCKSYYSRSEIYLFERIRTKKFSLKCWLNYRWPFWSSFVDRQGERDIRWWQLVSSFVTRSPHSLSLSLKKLATPLLFNTWEIRTANNHCSGSLSLRLAFDSLYKSSSLTDRSLYLSIHRKGFAGSRSWNHFMCRRKSPHLLGVLFFIQQNRFH